MFTKNSLLSLDDNPLTGKIIDYCAEGKRGYQTLLELRTVCKTTKKWVDNLPPTISRRIFLDTLIHLEVTRDNAKNYLNSSFSTINIPNLFAEFKDTCDMDFMGNQSDMELCKRFNALWKPRIESLEVVNCYCGEIGEHNMLMVDEEDTNPPNFRELKCHRLFAEKNSDPSALFRHFLFETERISVAYLDLTPPQKEEFYRRLIEKAGTLKYFATAPFYYDTDVISLPVLRLPPEDVPGTVRSLRLLVNAKKTDPDFTLVLNFDKFPLNLEENDQSLALVELFLSILDSVSNIKLYCFPENFMTLSHDILKEESTQMLCNRVFSVPYIMDEPEMFAKYTFPNLNHVGLTIPPGTLDADLRPFQSLTRLGTFGCSDVIWNNPNLLAPTLTQLRVCNWKAGVMDLVHEMNTISRSCPALRTLIMSYEIISDEIQPLEDIDVSLQTTSIQSVTIEVVKGNNVCAMLAGIISNAVCNLPLRKLKLELPPTAAVDENFFKTLKTPPILENIQRFSLNEESVDPAAVVFLNEMKLYAEGNKIRLRSSPQTLNAPKRTKRAYSLENDVEILCKGVKYFDL